MLDSLFVSIGLLAVVVLAVAGYLFFRIRRYFRGWGQYGMARLLFQFPPRLTLRPASKAAWQKRARSEERVAAFVAQGFEILSHFTIDEISSARLCALRHARTSLVGLVSEEENWGTWSDVLFFSQNEPQPVLASSVLKWAHFFLLPGDPKIHKADASETELAQAVLQSIGAGAVSRPVAVETIAGLIEQCFARAVDARLLAGLADGDIRRLLRDHLGGEEPLEDKTLASIKQSLPLVINNELRLTCSAQFLRENTVPASEWQHARGRVLVIHDRTPLPELAGRMIEGVYFTEALKKRLKKAGGSEPPREAFAQLNAALPVAERYKKLGEVTTPVPADIYRAPLDRPSIT
jgi:hypothetical protein